MKEGKALMSQFDLEPKRCSATDAAMWVRENTQSCRERITTLSWKMQNINGGKLHKVNMEMDPNQRTRLLWMCEAHYVCSVYFWLAFCMSLTIVLVEY